MASFSPWGTCVSQISRLPLRAALQLWGTQTRSGADASNKTGFPDFCRGSATCWLPVGGVMLKGLIWVFLARIASRIVASLWVSL